MATNALGHAIRYKYEGVDGTPYQGHFGVLVQTLAANGLTSIQTYDGFGRPISTERVHFGTTTLEYVNVGQPAGQFVKTRSPSGLETNTYFDGFGRVWRRERPTAAGQTVVSDTEVDGFGRVIRSWAPYFLSGPRPDPTSFKYDYKDRVTSQTSVGGGTTLFCYFDRLSVTVTPDGRRIDKILDNEDRVLRIAEYDGRAASCSSVAGYNETATRFSYDQLFGVVEIKDSRRTIDITYDAYSRRTSLNDTNVGEWKYVYNGEGRLAKQTNPDGSSKEYVYDVLGRPVEKIDRSRRGEQQKIKYVYDGYRSGIGSITSILEDDISTTRVYQEDGALALSIRSVSGRTYINHYYYDLDGNSGCANISRRVSSDI